MATVQLSDVIVPEIWGDYQAVNSPELSAFGQSGVVARNPLLDAAADRAGDLVNLPFWNDLDESSAPNISTDDPTDIGTPDKITAGKQMGYSAHLNKGWSASDLAAEVAGSNPMDRIRDRVDTYWTRQFQRRLIATAQGVLADNVANDSADMVHSVAVESTGSQSATTIFTRQNFTSAVFTAGDAFENSGLIAVHSNVYKTMVDNNDIDFVADSEGNLRIPTFLGHVVVVDDAMPARAGTTSGVVYTSVIFGAGAFGYGEGTPKVPVEVEREAAQGEGGGIETLWSRVTWLTHPFGFSASAAPASNAHTIAELQNAATWNRVVARKNVPMAFLITN